MHKDVIKRHDFAVAPGSLQASLNAADALRDRWHARDDVDDY